MGCCGFVQADAITGVRHLLGLVRAQGILAVIQVCCVTVL